MALPATTELIPIHGRNHEVRTWATVDACDYDRLSRYRWRLNGKFQTQGRRAYAITTLPRAETGGAHTHVLMHLMVQPRPEGMQVDHIDGDTLDNRRANLRVCTPSENARNSARKPKGGLAPTSIYKGVYRRYGRWQAQINLNHKTHKLGCFDDEKQAALAYDAAARKHFGKFCRINFPQEVEG